MWKDPSQRSSTSRPPSASPTRFGTAAATAVTVTLGADSDELHLTVADDGIGGVIRGVDDGHGLQGLWTRVEELGGRFEMRSAPGRGTIVAVSLPRRADRRPVS